MKFMPWILFASLILVGATGRGQEPSSKPIEVDDPSQSENSDSRHLPAQTPPKGTAVPTKVNRYAKYLMTKYDRNHDGVLQKDEWKVMHGHPEFIESKGDGVITLDDLVRWIANYSQRKRIGVPHEQEPEPEHAAVTKTASSTGEPDESNQSSSVNASPGASERHRDQKFFVPASRLPAGLPEWFLSKDQDGDGQLTAGEFSPTAIAAELAEFATYDANGDGIVTAKECVHKGTEKAVKDTNTAPGQAGAKQARKRRAPKPQP